MHIDFLKLFKRSMISFVEKHIFGIGFILLFGKVDIFLRFFCNHLVKECLFYQLS